MARSFPGGAATDNLAATITAYDSGPWTAFAWIYRAGGGGGGNSRFFQIGTGTSGQIFYWSGDAALATEQQFSVSQQLNVYNETTTGTWQFVVMGYDGATFNPDDDGGTSQDELFIYLGTVGSSMAQLDMGTTTTGNGSRTTGLTDLRIGNRQNGLNRCLNGEIFCVGMVPYMMSLADAELLRQGDLTALDAGTAPIFFFGLEGSDLNSYSGIGPSLTLTATGTSATADPITLTLGGGDEEVSPSVIAVSATVYAPTSISKTLPSVIAVSTTVYAPTSRGTEIPSVIAISSTVYAPTVKSIIIPSLIAVNTTVSGVEVAAITPQRRLRARPLRTVGHSAYLS